MSTPLERTRSIKRGLVVALMVVTATGYPACYVLARTSHLIVHRSSHTYDSHGHQVPSSHSVEAGDGKMASPNPIIAAFFTPLRWIETAVWYVFVPLGKPDGLP